MDWSTLACDVRRAEPLTITAERDNGFSALTGAGYPLLVERVSASSVDWLVVRVWVCTQDEMDPELVLERNSRLVYASLQLMQGAYWLRVAVPFDSAALSDPSRLVSFCIDAGRALSPYRVEPVAHASALFSHYAD